VGSALGHLWGTPDRGSSPPQRFNDGPGQETPDPPQSLKRNPQHTQPRR
jgi:hypothetical protein